MAPREPSRQRTRDRERERERERENGRRERDRDRDRQRDNQRRRQSAQPDRRAHEDDDERRARRSRSHGVTRQEEEDHDRRRSRRHTRGLSAEEVAHLEHEARRAARREERSRRSPPPPPREEYHEVVAEKPKRTKKNTRRRHVSGAILEEGRGWTGLRGGASTEDGTEKELLYKSKGKQPMPKKKKQLLMFIGVGVTLLIILIAVAVVVSKRKSGDEDEDGPSKSSLDDKDRDSVPAEFQGTDLDPWSWHDTSDFNVTFTAQTVGDLPVMGLFTDWDDSQAANGKVPALAKSWGSYGDRPARGVNLGGWLSLEPFITPSLFAYGSGLGIVDEYTLTSYLGGRTREVLEKHYATFVTEQTFKEIADAGLDHVRIPFSYWAVETYEGDPYLFRTSWRYLLRGIEWARKYGLRINLDVHGLPGSQNGWNHSGRLGPINFLSGADGDTYAKRALDMHDRLSKFFAQDRYKNIIAFYGLANEPKMTTLAAQDVIAWTEDAYKVVRGNGVDAVVVFGDGFMGLGNWKGKLSGLTNLALDVHQYVIFNKNQIVYTHREKVEYACRGWTKQAEESMDTSTGFGPTLFAEWSQADTDCARHLTNVGWGNRWEGTFDTGDAADSVLTPRCPAEDASCSCAMANADVDSYSSPYRRFLKTFAEAQMHSFEKGWGWWYWTWQTESAPQWSYKAGLAAGILPDKAYEREFDCGEVPDFEGLPETY